jgi:hypothetical protein
MNTYKRSVRLKFSTWFIHKDEGLQIHLQTWFAVTFLVAQMKFPPLSPVDITDKLHCDWPTLNPHFRQVHTSFTHFQGNHKNKNKEIPSSSQNIPEGSGNFMWKWSWLTNDGANFSKENSHHWKWTNHKTTLKLSSKEFKWIASLVFCS